VGIDGFLRGRRYIVAQGEPDFFTLYNVRDAGVLSGAAYHARLNDPTPWTLKAVTYFSNEYRSLCEIKASQGIGSGGLIGTIRFDCDVERDVGVMAHLAGLALPAVTRRPAIAAMHVCRADLETSRRRSAEQQDRGDNRVPRWIVLVEGTTLEAIAEALDGSLGSKALSAAGVQIADRGVYRLQHDLVKSIG
jgi:hypothetical protein